MANIRGNYFRRTATRGIRATSWRTGRAREGAEKGAEGVFRDVPSAPRPRPRAERGT